MPSERALHPLIHYMCAHECARALACAQYQFITNARCRVAICHGTDDLVVSWWNGRKLHALCGADAFEPLWCEGRGHNDMDTEAVLAWAASFLDSLCNGEIRRDI